MRHGNISASAAVCRSASDQRGQYCRFISAVSLALLQGSHRGKRYPRLPLGEILSSNPWPSERVTTFEPALVAVICRTGSAMAAYRASLNGGIYHYVYHLEAGFERNTGEQEGLKNNVFQCVTHHFWTYQDFSKQRGGVPGRSRTCDLPLRRRLLYPTELQGLMRSGSITLRPT